MKSKHILYENFAEELMNQIYEYKVTKAKYLHYEFEIDIQRLLDEYAKDGWQLKNIIPKEGKYEETVFIFERYHPEYKTYNNAIVDYIIEAK